MERAPEGAVLRKNRPHLPLPLSKLFLFVSALPSRFTQSYNFARDVQREPMERYRQIQRQRLMGTGIDRDRDRQRWGQDRKREIVLQEPWTLSVLLLFLGP